MSRYSPGCNHTRNQLTPQSAAAARRRSVIGIVAVALAAAGCGQQEAVRHYRVPKPELVYAANHVRSASESAAPPVRAANADRLLGAIVPRDDRTWYFKMVGPRDAVTQEADAFRALIASLAFDDAQSAPRWQLPESWRELPGTGQRVATLRIDAAGKALEVSVIALASGPAETAVLDNVNRWRSQMGRSSVTAAQLGTETETIQLAQGSAILVDIIGSLQEGTGAMVASPHPEAPPAHPTPPNNRP